MNTIEETLDNLNLNESQKRYLTSSFVTIEKLLRHILNLLQNEPQPGIFYQPVNDVPDETSVYIQKQVLELLNRLHTLKVQFNLQAVEEKNSRILASELSLCWASLLDTRPKILSGYGPLTENTANKLEMEINALTLLTTALIYSINKPN